MGQQVPICQSCSMPLRRPEDCGTNTDGSKTYEYCHFCFMDGKFINPELTLDQQIEKMAGMAAKMNIPQDAARQMAQTILPTLKRWQT
ncbi:MAG: hypothetical protein HQ596_00830 [Candidatus Saganbacteria bacterium]|nr:hypothetical protein [Candidatus Saganbacteria bacterium]